MVISGSTRILGILGHPVKHSVSPAMHNAAFEALCLDLVYLPLPTPPDKLAVVLDTLEAVNALGCNVTVPYKQKVIPLLDEITPLAKRIGAVNTILFKNGKKIGYNTDGRGFSVSLSEELGFSCPGKKAVILGAGGAARSVADRFLELEAEKLVIANRTESKARALADHLKLGFNREIISVNIGDPELKELISEADIVVNTTSLGLEAGDPSPIPGEWLNSKQIAADLIYNPVRTTFLKTAAGFGLKTVNGLGMLVFQGALAFEIWTGKKPSIEVMKTAVADALGL